MGGQASAAAAEHAGVLVTPASAFLMPGNHAPSAVRLSLSYEASDERLAQGLKILARVLGSSPSTAYPV